MPALSTENLKSVIFTRSLKKPSYQAMMHQFVGQRSVPKVINNDMMKLNG